MTVSALPWQSVTIRRASMGLREASPPPPCKQLFRWARVAVPLPSLTTHGEDGDTSPDCQAAASVCNINEEELLEERRTHLRALRNELALSLAPSEHSPTAGRMYAVAPWVTWTRRGSKPPQEGQRPHAFHSGGEADVQRWVGFKCSTKATFSKPSLSALCSCPQPRRSLQT